MLDFDALKKTADRSATVTKDGNSYSFRKISAISVDDAVVLKERASDMSIVQLLSELAAFDGCEVSADEISKAFEEWEIQLILKEVSSAVTLGES